MRYWNTFPGSSPVATGDMAYLPGSEDSLQLSSTSILRLIVRRKNSLRANQHHHAARPHTRPGNNSSPHQHRNPTSNSETAAPRISTPTQSTPAPTSSAATAAPTFFPARRRHSHTTPAESAHRFPRGPSPQSSPHARSTPRTTPFRARPHTRGAAHTARATAHPENSIPPR